MVKIRNKNTGEVIDLSTGSRSTPKQEEVKKSITKKPASKIIDERFAKTDKRIKERGTIQDQARKIIAKDSSMLDKIGGVGSMISAPFDAIESAISNPLLLAQRGEMDIAQLSNETINRIIPPPIRAALRRDSETPAGDRIAEAVVSGATLQEQGQYGDILKNIGVPDTVADATGLFLNIAGPAKILQAVNSLYGKFAKISDKAMLEAGENLIRGVNASRKAMGIKVGEAYKVVDDAMADSTKFIDDIAKLPDNLKNAAVDEFGDMAEYSKNLTVRKLVEFKRWLGKFRKGQWDKAEKGLEESILEIRVDKAYGAMKDAIKKTVAAAQGDEYAEMVMGLESAFSNVSKAGRFIKGAVVNGKLTKPTKVGTFAKQLISETDQSARFAIDVIRKSSGMARKFTLRALRTMQKFNRLQRSKELLGKTAGAAIFGGAVGAIGGGVIQKLSSE